MEAEALFCLWGRVVKGERSKIFIKVILAGVLWGIWKERNKRVFEDKRSVWVVIDSIVCEISSWVLVKEFQNCSMNDMVKDWVSCILGYRTTMHSPTLEFRLGPSQYR